MEGSHFDPEYAARARRASFFRRFVREVTLPVMPQDEEAKYLPTQVVAEYLANKVEPRLDGSSFVRYRPTMTARTWSSLIMPATSCEPTRLQMPG